ncbi:hypothetical protein ACFXC8_19750 [Streptomyces sp. NPDC059441]|uniref:hypothetical protein n=1 Tax=Streptomyces sp. NPDC059441 TaxID=3346829 RepID=UPI0036D1C5B3
MAMAVAAGTLAATGAAPVAAAPARSGTQSSSTTVAASAASDCDVIGVPFEDGPIAEVAANAVSHTGPYGKCYAYEPTSTYVQVHCRYNNRVPNLWYYTDHGWIYSGYFSRSYSVPTCSISG